MWISTFHAACVRILRRNVERIGYRPGFTIYDDGDSRRLVEHVLDDLGVDQKRFPPRAVLGVISSAKSDLLDVSALQERAGHDLRGADRPGLRRVRAPPRRRQRDGLRRPARPHGAPVPRPPRRARAVPGPLRARARRRVPGHERAPRTSSSSCSDRPGATSASSATPTRASTASGAPRCATCSSSSAPSPTRDVIILDQNYRSTQTILDAANAVISNNLLRQEKDLWSALGKGEPIRRYRAGDDRDEASFVANEIATLSRDEGVGYNDIAVFYRTNAQSRALETALADRGIAYTVIGGTRFYDRREIRDVLAYLRARRQPGRRGVAAPHPQHAASRRRRHDGGQAARVRRREGGRVRGGAARTPSWPGPPARPWPGSGACSPCSRRSGRAISSRAHRTI